MFTSGNVIFENSMTLYVNDVNIPLTNCLHSQLVVRFGERESREPS